MRPTLATDIPVKKQAISTSLILFIEGFIPRFDATLSPNCKRFASLYEKIEKIRPITVIGKRILI